MYGKCQGCHRQMVATVSGGCGCPCVGTPFCIKDTGPLNYNVRVEMVRKPSFPIEWGFSPMGCPACPPQATHWINYWFGSDSKLMYVEYFGSYEAANCRLLELRKWYENRIDTSEIHGR